MSLIFGLPFMFFSKVIPSISGIITSEMTRSYGSVSNALRASLPFGKSPNLYQLLSSLSMNMAISGSSSTTIILTFLVGWTRFFLFSISTSSVLIISSGLRCEFPSGNNTSKQEPLTPSVLLYALIFPPCIVVIALQRLSPIPVPSIWKSFEFSPW